jgi:hypothetical protein
MSGEERFFWSCPCMSEEWQRVYGKGQPRCGTCLSVARFFGLSRVDQAVEIQRLYVAQQSLSSWLAVNLGDAAMVTIPRDIAEVCAGWAKWKTLPPPPPQTR